MSRMVIMIQVVGSGSKTLKFQERYNPEEVFPDVLTQNSLNQYKIENEID